MLYVMFPSSLQAWKVKKNEMLGRRGAVGREGDARFQARTICKKKL